MTKKRIIVIAAFLAVAGVALWYALAGPESRETKDILNGRERLILLDGAELTETVVSPETEADLWVVISQGNEVVAVLPFGEEHKVEIIQKSGRNTFRTTRDAAYMEDADCPGKDCVEIYGRFTRENWDIRQPDTITCLPHKLVIRVTDDLRFLE